jgi:hypothetical protein
MQACAGCPDRKLLVHVVWQRDVDGIDLSAREELIDTFITAEALYAVAAAKNIELFPLARHERSQRAVAARMLERRQHGSLRNVAQSDDSVPDSLPPRRSGAV